MDDLFKQLFVGKRFFMTLILALFMASCAKERPVIGQASPTLTQQHPVTSADETKAFDDFNIAYYSPVDELYYATTERKDIGAIWTQAVYWDVVINAYKRTNSPAYLKMVNDIYDGGYKKYDGYNWDNKAVWFIYDDMMWWVISLTNAYQLTGNPVYLEKAKAGFARVWAGSYDPVDGGMFWDFQHSGKNACINYPTVIAAMKLYGATKDESYFTKAKDIYNWSRNNLYDQQTGRVADNKIGSVAGYSDYTYNYGTCIGAGISLFNATENSDYLSDAKLAASYVRSRMTDSNGILPAEGDWNEQGVLKSILAQYLVQLLPFDSDETISKWIDKNINSAWQNRDKNRGIMYRDYKIQCPPGTLQSYESSSAVAFMQLFIPLK
jgi:predicted alpha-1,6-mannanase (GH76 family)